MSLTPYEKALLEYLEYFEEKPKDKGGLDENERIELFKLREKIGLGDKA